MLRLFQEKGIDVKEIYPRVRTKRQGSAMEIDILAIDDTELVLVECKSRLSKDDVDEFIEKLEHFKVSFPHYKDYQAYGAVAGIKINEGIDRYAYQKGLFVIKLSGDSVENRPAIADMKTEIGHWESDTVIGVNHSGVVVTHVDKASKYLLFWVSQEQDNGRD